MGHFDTLGDVMEELFKDLGSRVVNCEKHGDYTSKGTDFKGHENWGGCPECSKEYHIEYEKQQALERRDAKFVRACIPLRFYEKWFEDYLATTDQQKNARKVSEDFLASFEANPLLGHGLVFSGSPGTGKSHLALTILKYALRRQTGLYSTAIGIVRMVRDTWKRDSEKTEIQVLSELAKYDLLVIDEIGSQYGTEGEQHILFDVIDSRYRNLKATILLTNMGRDKFKEYLGERSYDRLRETSKWVSFDWPSYRPQARKDIDNGQ